MIDGAVALSIGNRADMPDTIGCNRHGDAQYFFAEDVLGHTGPQTAPARTCHNFAAEYERLQTERVAAFKEFIDDINTGGYPAPEHTVPIADAGYEAFVKSIGR